MVSLLARKVAGNGPVTAFLIVASAVFCMDGEPSAAEIRGVTRPAERVGKPIPSGTEAKTFQTFVQDRLGFNLRTTVDAYRQVGSRGEMWDEAAIDFLTEVARNFSEVEQSKTRTELVQMAELLVETGCDDPLVTYFHGALLQDLATDSVSRLKALELVEKSYPGLVGRGYPANRLTAAAKRAYKHYQNDSSQTEKAEALLRLCKTHLRDEVLQDDLSSNEGRTIYHTNLQFFASLPLDKRGEICDAIKVHQEKSPFVVNMIIGDYHYRAAWAARGSGFASTVTEEGWQGFEEHLPLARAAFERAYEAAPGRPETAAAMIAVARDTSPSPLREMRLWFDRAVAAEMDWYPAYQSFTWGLLPRWHGSHDQLYEFGVECLETKRFDTRIPYEFCECIRDIIQDPSNPLGTKYAERPGLYERVRQVCEGYLEHGITKDAARYQTTWLGYACLTQHWADAERLLAQLGPNVDSAALSRIKLSKSAVVEAVCLHASRHADAITAAYDAADRGDREIAVDALSEILQAPDLEPEVSRYLTSRLQVLNWERQFHEWHPVALTPAATSGGWISRAGKWNVTEAGALRGVSGTTGAVLECKADFGQYWQLSGEVYHGNMPHDPWSAGVFINFQVSPQLVVLFNPTQEWVAAGPLKTLADSRKPFQSVGKTTKFVIRVAGNTVSVWLDDTLVIEDQPFEGLESSLPSRLAIGVISKLEGAALTYKSLEISQIPPPEEPL